MSKRRLLRCMPMPNSCNEAVGWRRALQSATLVSKFEIAGSFGETVRVWSSAFKGRRGFERVAHVQQIAAADRPKRWRVLGSLRALRALRRKLSFGVGRQGKLSRIQSGEGLIPCSSLIAASTSFMRYHLPMIDQALKVQAMSLSAPDRLELIGTLWDSLSSEDVPVTDADKALLDARLADADAHPDDESPWTEVRARLRQQLPR